MKIYFCELPDGVTTESVISYLPTSRREELQKIKSEKNRALSAYATLLAIAVISKNSGIDTADIQFDKLEYGKPVVKNYPEIHFNLSHTDGMIVCAYASSPVGVDVEHQRFISKQATERILTYDEFDLLEDSPETEMNSVILDIWTKKEAFTKCEGAGLLHDFGTINTEDSELAPFFHLEKIGRYTISSFSKDTSYEAPVPVSFEALLQIIKDCKQFYIYS